MADPRAPLRRMIALAQAGATFVDTDLDDVAAEVAAAVRHQPETETDTAADDPLLVELRRKVGLPDPEGNEQ